MNWVPLLQSHMWKDQKLTYFHSIVLHIVNPFNAVYTGWNEVRCHPEVCKPHSLSSYHFDRHDSTKINLEPVGWNRRVSDSPRRRRVEPTEVGRVSGAVISWGCDGTGWNLSIFHSQTPVASWRNEGNKARMFCIQMIKNNCMKFGIMKNHWLYSVKDGGSFA